MALKISAAEYHRRRRQLSLTLGVESVLIVPAAHEARRNRDVHYPFRQASDFSWLTGFPEPDAIAVLIPQRRRYRFILFCHPQDPTHEIWTGHRYGLEGAKTQFGAHHAYPLAELEQKLPELIAGRRRIYVPFDQYEQIAPQLWRWIRQLRTRTQRTVLTPTELIDAGVILHEARLRKSRAEIALLRQAAEIAATAHKSTMRLCRPGLNEADLENHFLYTCAQQGARYSAYPPIVGSGVNGCILHYVDNKAVLQAGDLVLMDAGCEWQGYASDITRTFPVNGRFTSAQREIYNIVLQAQQAALAHAKPGQAYHSLHDAAVRVITQGLWDLGLIGTESESLRELLTDQAYKPFYMHQTGHWLGLDVHDVGAYQENGHSRRLEPGMVLTVEPGIYLADKPSIPEPYRRIGIRIEDDIVITDTGYDLLSAQVPKESAAIEAWMAG
jgi:Xaa-Pro aminopeptidase